MKVYSSLMKRRSDLASEEVFADFSGETAEGQERLFSYEMLVEAKKSTPETHPDQQPQVISDYLNRTFMQEQALNKILYSIDGGKASFNIGLRTGRSKKIYALFYKNPHSGMAPLPDWVFYSFVSCYL